MKKNVTKPINYEYSQERIRMQYFSKNLTLRNPNPKQTINENDKLFVNGNIQKEFESLEKTLKSKDYLNENEISENSESSSESFEKENISDENLDESYYNIHSVRNFNVNQNF